MKRFLVVIPVTLLLLVTSCTGNASLALQAAVPGTPTPIFTVSPAITNMIDATNSDLRNTNSLAWVMDAQYYLIDVIFQNSPNQFGLIAQFNVSCICMNGTDCCTAYKHL